MIGGEYDEPWGGPWDAIGEFNPDTGRVEWNPPSADESGVDDSGAEPYDWQSDGEFADRPGLTDIRVAYPELRDAPVGAEPTQPYGFPIPEPEFSYASAPVPDWQQIVRELQGITSGQLAVGVGEFINDAQMRVLGVGREQYDEGDGQKFERMPLPQLCDWALEELQDVAVYAAMLAIRIQRIKDQFSGTPA